jgi:hypothetical protein
MPSPSATRELVQDFLKDSMPYGGLYLRNRHELFEPFTQIPLLNASVLITDTNPTLAQAALRFRANRNWEINGTGTVADADQAFSLEGGIRISTDAATPAANENTYITPHLDTTQTQWALAGIWGSEDEVVFSCQVAIPSIVAAHVRAGLFEDAAQPADLATTGSDDNAAFFLFDEDQATSAANWIVVINIANADTLVNTNTPVVAGTEYLLEIRIGVDRKPKFFINGKLVHTGTTALTNNVDFIPQIAVGTDTTAAKTLDIRWVRCSRDRD